MKRVALALVTLTSSSMRTPCCMAAASAISARLQRPDGGWAQLPTLDSDAYATGEALVALTEAGGLAPTDATYVRGMRFLLSTQFDDGSGHVKTRTLALQPYFEAGFPWGRDQFISRGGHQLGGHGACAGGEVSVFLAAGGPLHYTDAHIRRYEMKPLAAALTIAGILSGTGTVAIRAAGATTIVGYISDTKCASASAKAKTAAEWIKPEAFERCVKDCVKEGSEAVFLTEDNKILKLDAASAKKTTPFLGHKVRVVGNVQGSTIAIESITGLKLE